MCAAPCVHAGCVGALVTALCVRRAGVSRPVGAITRGTTVGRRRAQGDSTGALGDEAFRQQRDALLLWEDESGQQVSSDGPIIGIEQGSAWGGT